MKLLPALFTALFLTTRFAPGQEAPAPAAPGPEKPAQVVPAPAPAPEDLSLIPELPMPGKKPKGGAEPAAKKSSTEQASDDLQARVRYRQVKTKALADPKLQQEWDRAQTAGTSAEKRDALMSYYRRLYDRMVAIDPTMKPRVAAQRKALAWRLEPRTRKHPKEAVPKEAAPEVTEPDAAEY